VETKSFEIIAIPCVFLFLIKFAKIELSKPPDNAINCDFDESQDFSKI
jgi:hypothetical protein